MEDVSSLIDDSVEVTDRWRYDSRVRDEVKRSLRNVKWTSRVMYSIYNVLRMCACIYSYVHVSVCAPVYV